MYAEADDRLRACNATPRLNAGKSDECQSQDDRQWPKGGNNGSNVVSVGFKRIGLGFRPGAAKQSEDNLAQEIPKSAVHIECQAHCDYNRDNMVIMGFALLR